MSILEGELAQTITEALIDADIPFDMAIKRTVVTPPANNWEEGEEVTTTYPCKGFIETYSDLLRAGTAILEGDYKIIILTQTLAIDVRLSDIVVARGRPYAIVSIGYDPAMATIELQAR